jgi:hypothetical protein
LFSQTRLVTLCSKILKQGEAAGQNKFHVFFVLAACNNNIYLNKGEIMVL